MSSDSTDKIILPPKYYLDYFQYLLDFVQKHYLHVLGDPETSFLQAFGNLSEDAQLLFVRFSNRKGPFYRLSKINYEEIGDVDAAAKELASSGFLTRDLLNVYEVYNLFTRAELYEIFREELQEYRHLKKIEWIVLLLEGEDNYLRLQVDEDVVSVEKQREFEFFKLLFFGSYKMQMTEFVIRDIGNVTLQELDEDKFSPWCQSREEAIAFFEVSELKSLVRKAMKMIPALEVHQALPQAPWDEFQRYPHAAKALGKLCIEFGQQLEREDAFEEALFYYELTTQPPARERRVRILNAQGQQDLAASLAEEMLDDYHNASERIFAKDFLARKKVRINRSTTSRLTKAPSVVIPQQEGMRVERLAVEFFEGLGYQALHSENFIWRNIFGLIFWEDLFDQSGDSFHHPLQRVPSDIYMGFFDKRKDRLLDTLQSLKTRKSIEKHLHKTMQQKQGLSNPFVYWYEGQSDHLISLVRALRPKQLHAVLLEMAKNPKDNATGFPDLFVWKESEYWFYEIKSPNDHLSSQQLFWLDFMQSQGIKSDILRVEYGQ